MGIMQDTGVDMEDCIRCWLSNNIHFNSPSALSLQAKQNAVQLTRLNCLLQQGDISQEQFESKRLMLHNSRVYAAGGMAILVAPSVAQYGQVHCAFKHDSSDCSSLNPCLMLLLLSINDKPVCILNVYAPVEGLAKTNRWICNCLNPVIDECYGQGWDVIAAGDFNGVDHSPVSVAMQVGVESPHTTTTTLATKKFDTHRLQVPEVAARFSNVLSSCEDPPSSDVLTGMCKAATATLSPLTYNRDGEEVGLTCRFTHKAVKVAHHVKMCMINNSPIVTMATMHKLASAPEWACCALPQRWSQVDALTYLSQVEWKSKLLRAQLESLLQKRDQDHIGRLLHYEPLTTPSALATFWRCLSNRGSPKRIEAAMLTEDGVKSTYHNPASIIKAFTNFWATQYSPAHSSTGNHPWFHTC
jgi:hypothetical protein